MNTDPNSNPPFQFGGVQARLVYEWIDKDGKWEQVSETIHRIPTGYDTLVRDRYNEAKAKFAERADRRNLRIEAAPAQPEWVEVPFAPDTNLADIEGTLFACLHATWTPARVPAYHSPMTAGEFVQAVVDGGGTNIE